MDETGASPWADAPLRRRLEWVAAFRRAVAGAEAEFGALAESELGRPRFQTLVGDLMPLLAAARWLERHGASVLRPTRPPGGAWWLRGQRQSVVRAPLGTVAIIATWNYPLHLLGVQLMQALAAGNRVVVKPSERAPRTQARLLQTARDAGLPEGVLEWTDWSREAGARLLAERRFDKVVFTGSTDVGREVAGACAGTLTPSALELSGRDSAIVLDDADPDLAAGVLFTAVAFNAGQTCMAPRRALVHRDVYGRFVGAMSPRAAGAAPVALIDEAAARTVHGLAADALSRGARSLSGVLEPPNGRAMRPAIMGDCPADAALVEGRHFGPAIALVPVSSVDEALEIHARCDQHLLTSVFTRSPARARAMAPRLGAATVAVNDSFFPTAHPGASIAGTGRSGWGLTRGREGLLAMTRGITIAETSTMFRPNVEPLPGAWTDRIAAVVTRAYGARRARAEERGRGLRVEGVG